MFGSVKQLVKVKYVRICAILLIFAIVYIFLRVLSLNLSISRLIKFNSFIQVGKIR